MLQVQGISKGEMDGGAALLLEFGNHSLNIQFITHLLDQHQHSYLTLAIDREDIRPAFDLLTRLQKQLGALSIKLKTPVATIGIYGPDFRHRPGIAGIFLHSLKQQNIPIFAISTSISTCSALIPEREASKAQSAIGNMFLLP